MRVYVSVCLSSLTIRLGLCEWDVLGDSFWDACKSEWYNYANKSVAFAWYARLKLEALIVFKCPLFIVCIHSATFLR